MSGWLASVNTLLDQLDGEVEHRIHSEEVDDDEFDESPTYINYEDEDEDQEELLLQDNADDAEDMAVMVSTSDQDNVANSDDNDDDSSSQEKVRYSITEDDNVDASFFSADDGMVEATLSSSFLQLNNIDEREESAAISLLNGNYENQESIVPISLDASEINDNVISFHDASQSQSHSSVDQPLKDSSTSSSKNELLESTQNEEVSRINEGNLHKEAKIVLNAMLPTENTINVETINAIKDKLNSTHMIAKGKDSKTNVSSSSLILKPNQEKLLDRTKVIELERINDELRQQMKSLKGQISIQSSRHQKSINSLEKQVKNLNRSAKNLNNELEIANNEVKAQQEELYSAAERIEHDKLRHKEAIANLESQHHVVITNLESDHISVIEGLKASFVLEIESLKDRLKRVDEDRNDEVGDWEGELNSVLKREKDLLAKVTLLEGDKSTLKLQASSLTGQLDAIQSRLDASTSTAYASTEREREAFEKLDEVLSTHAKQIAQRQTREAELEREVNDLGKALIEAQLRERERLSSASLAGQNSSEDGDMSIKSLKDELDAMKELLQQEKQHNITLNKEIRVLSEERSKEDAAAIARQRQHDRETAELVKTISNIESSLKTTKEELDESKQQGQYSNSHSLAILEYQDRIGSLSDEVLRQQTKIENTASEISAFRQRLRVALHRADSSEKALIELQTSTSGDGYDAFDSIEDGLLNRGMRRRKGRQGTGGSIRSAINLNPSGDGKQKQIAKAIDTVDKISVEAGLYMRYNPLARGIFLLYLLVLHVFTFSILVFHVHNGQEVNRDFGQGIGPGSLAGVKNQFRSP